VGNAKDRVGAIDGVHYAPGFTLVICLSITSLYDVKPLDGVQNHYGLDRK
jgi:hypothetical protein